MASRRGFLQLADKILQCFAIPRLSRDSAEQEPTVRVGCGSGAEVVTLWPSGICLSREHLGWCVKAFEDQAQSPRCIRGNDFKQVICLLVLCFLCLDYVADGIWPVIKQDWTEAPTITSKLRLYVEVPGNQGNTVYLRTLQADMASGLLEGGGVLLEMSPAGTLRHAVCKQGGDSRDWGYHSYARCCLLVSPLPSVKWES